MFLPLERGDLRPLLRAPGRFSPMLGAKRFLVAVERLLRQFGALGGATAEDQREG